MSNHLLSETFAAKFGYNTVPYGYIVTVNKSFPCSISFPLCATLVGFYALPVNRKKSRRI